MHTRIPFDLRTATGIARYRAFALDSARLVVRHGGSLSGEHGDGQSRAELLPIMFGARLVGAFEELKAVFDPQERMNPGKIVHPYRLDENLRQGANYLPLEPATHFAYPDDDHRFSRAAARTANLGGTPPRLVRRTGAVVVFGMRRHPCDGGAMAAPDFVRLYV